MRWGRLVAALSVAAGGAAAQPAPKYFAEEGGEYAYTAEVSENARRDGQAIGNLVMVRYLGKIDGRHTVRVVRPSGYNEWSCSDPCKLIRHRMFIGGKEVEADVVPYAPGSILAAVFDDAIAGHLKRYMGSRPGGRR